MMEVLFIEHRDMYFGAESVMYRIIMMLKDELIAKPSIVLPLSGHCGFSKKMADDHVDRLRFKLIGGSGMRCIMVLVYNIGALIKLYLFYRKKHIDTIFTNTSVNILGPLLAFVLGKRHIWHFHEQPTGGNFKWIPKLLFPLYRACIRRKTTTIVFISNSQKMLWEKEFNMRIDNAKVIYNAPAQLDGVALNTSEKCTVTFGYLGSWTSSKNLIGLINCFAQLHRNDEKVDFDLVLMGAGEMEEEIRSAISSLQIENKVRLMPHSANVLPFFEAVDIFVLPSFFESWGLVVLEAIQQQKSVIVTRNTGLIEILEDNVDCLFIDPNQDGELYEAMQKLLLDTAYRHQIAAHAKQKLDKLNLDGHFKASIVSLFTQTYYG